MKRSKALPLLVLALISAVIIFFETGLFEATKVKKSSAVIVYRNNLALTTLVDKLFMAGGPCKSIMGSDKTFKQHSTRFTLVNISFNCYDLFKYSKYGTGNYMIALYAVRVAAHALGMTDLIIQCDDAEEHKDSLILPWTMGFFPRIPPGDPEANEQPSAEQACKTHGISLLGWVWKDMLFELRRLAIAMVGIPSPDHPSSNWAEENLWTNPSASHRRGRDYMQLPHPKRGDIPLFPDIQLDDAVLHFRCGDMVDSDHPGYGFMKFGSYSRHLSPDVRTIGIVTEPFEADAQARNREAVGWQRNRCRVIIGAFVEHLRERFPNARISVRNNRNETIALTYARMIMANQTVVGITSFGVFPAMSTFGTGYIQKADPYGNFIDWLLMDSPLLERLENVTLMEEPVLRAPIFRRMWGSNSTDANGTDAIAWFQNYVLQAPFNLTECLGRKWLKRKWYRRNWFREAWAWF